MALLKAKASAHGLSLAQEEILTHFFTLDGSDDDAFRDEEHMRHAWRENRERLMLAARPLTRPAGFWYCEIPTSEWPWPRGETEGDALRRLALLTPAEEMLLRGAKYVASN